LSDLVGVEKVSDFVETILYTGRIAGASPVSALLIGTPETGKTTVCKELVTDSKCKTAVILTDCTGRGLMGLCQAHPEVSHFIINDLVTVMAHRDTVNRYTLSVIQAMTEEGLQSAAYPGQVEVFTHGKRAIIACSTPEMIRDRRAWWHRHGLASRMLPFYYDHSVGLMIRIKDYIETDRPEPARLNGASGVIRLRIPEKPQTITIPATIAATVRKLSDHRANVLGDPKGYRRLKQYRTILKARALARARKKTAAKVEPIDLEWLEQMDGFISYRKPREL
jgi:hypothetical protein